MADVSRTSTFPPILRRYHSGVFTSSEPFRALHAVKASKIGEPEGQRRQDPPSGKGGRKGGGGGGGGSNQQPGSSSGLLSTDKIRRENELELKRKRNQRAEATLMCWDTLLEEHRLQQYQTLQRRVGIQRDLITKNDQLFIELRKKDEEERLEKIQAKKSEQKKLTESLRRHIKKIEEHKKKIAEKFNALKAEEPLEEDYVNDTTEQTASSPVHYGQTQDETTLAERENNKQNVSAQNEVSNAVYQMLGCDNSKPDTRAMLESLWGGKKSATNKRLRPIIQYSDQLKQEASPSVKQCLEVYEQPTAHDRYTGKPIPLGEILHEIINKAEVGTNHSNWNNAIELMSKHMQKRAQALMRRKDPYNSLDPALSSNEGWFTELCDEREDRVRAKTASASLGSIVRRKHKDSLLHKRAKSSGTTVKMKKKLPTFLTPDGNLLTSSLEKFGSQLYCGPSRDSGVPATDIRGGHTSIGSSVFLTDLQNTESVENVTFELKQTAEAVRWQPLSLGALTEHSSVTEIPVKGLGNTAHGKYSMWKPDLSFSVGASQ